MEELVMFAGAYAGWRVFVTGHTGFKGSWLTLWLLELGADVTGFALEPPTEPSLFAAADVGAATALPGTTGRFTDVRGDVRDRAAIEEALVAAAPEIVFHLAAQPLVRRSYAEPHLTYETNVMGTVNLLEAVRVAAAGGRAPRVVVNVTSDKCYEERGGERAYRESDPLGGGDPYSSSKGCAELVTAAYHTSYFSTSGATLLASARAGNVIGGGDWGDDRLIPDCVRALSACRPVELRHPDAVRPWQHVLESLSGYLWLAASLWREAETRTAGAEGAAAAGLAGAWNFGPGGSAEVTVREVVELFLQAWGGGEWRPAPGAARQPREAGLLRLDAGKAGRELGWRGVWSVSRSVDAAAAWYRAHVDGAGAGDLRELCRGDIASYSADAAARGLPWAVGE